MHFPDTYNPQELLSVYNIYIKKRVQNKIERCATPYVAVLIFTTTETETATIYNMHRCNQLHQYPPQNVCDEEAHLRPGAHYLCASDRRRLQQKRAS